LVQPKKIQEQKSFGADFSQSSSIPAQQQACQPVTKDEYCINTVDRKLQK
jgi:hypothetical protein